VDISAGRDLEKEQAECGEGSALSTLSNALVKLKEPPPTRPRRAGEMGDEVSSKKPFALIPRTVVSSSDSDGELSDTVCHLEAAGKKSVKLAQSKQISALPMFRRISCTAEGSDIKPAGSASDTNPARNKPFEFQRKMLSSGQSFFLC